MSDDIKIPKGWRKVRHDAVVKKGDFRLSLITGGMARCQASIGRVAGFKLIIRPQARRSASRSRNKEPHPSRNKGERDD